MKYNKGFAGELLIAVIVAVSLVLSVLYLRGVKEQVGAPFVR